MRRLTILSFLPFASIFLGCSKNNQAFICDSDAAFILESGSCLVFTDAGELDDERAMILTIIEETVMEVNAVMPVDNIGITVQVAPSRAIPEIGMGGFNPGPNEVILSFDPSFPDISASILKELKPLLAHEMHHAKRRREVGYGSTLLEAMVSEGMADCFAIEIAGIDPPIWSVALSEEQLASWKEASKASWNNSSYDHQKWFFGSSNVPRWAGYTIGFNMVKDYIADNPDRKASNLVNEPAGSFTD
ncbi:MAG: DUF2268 domain-containing putative Zn-dependent protease [Cyclobacteriaceae bacterium]